MASTWIMADAFRYVVGTSLPALIVAARPATEQNRVPLAICHVMFNAHIRSATGVARSLVLHVQSRRVCHPARIASAPCPALLHVIIYLARDVVKSFWNAVINAHQSAERSVLHGSFVNDVPVPKSKSVWSILSWPKRMLKSTSTRTHASSLAVVIS